MRHTADYRRDAQAGGNQGIIANLSNATETWFETTVFAGQVKDGFGTFDTLVSIERVRGTSAADVFVSGATNNTFEGGLGADTFVFGPNNGQDTIADFESGAGLGDSITLRGIAGFDDFGDLQQVGVLSEFDADGDSVADDVLIELGGGNTIALLNRTIAQLHSDDFTFLA